MLRAQLFNGWSMFCTVASTFPSQRKRVAARRNLVRVAHLSPFSQSTRGCRRRHRNRPPVEAASKKAANKRSKKPHELQSLIFRAEGIVGHSCRYVVALFFFRGWFYGAASMPSKTAINSCWQKHWKGMLELFSHWTASRPGRGKKLRGCVAAAAGWLLLQSVNSPVIAFC